jgi:hypothetical protein
MKLRPFSRLVALSLLGSAVYAGQAYGTWCDAASEIVDENILSGSGELAHQTQEGFANSPKRDDIEKIYREGANFFYEDALPTGAWGGGWYVGRVRERLQNQSDPHVVGLKRLGFEFIRNADGSVTIAAPRRLETIFSKHAAIVDFWIAKGKIQPENALLLAIPVLNKATGKYEFIAPGVDPWPADFEVPQSIPQFTHVEFYRAIARGRFPVVFGKEFLHHDLAHVTSKGDSPVIMAETVRYARELIAREGGDATAGSAHPTKEVTTYRWPGTPAPAMRERSSITEEWLFLPDVMSRKHSETIRDIVERMKDLPEASFEAVHKRLQEMNDFGEYVKWILGKKPRELLAASGGGARDGNSPDNMFYKESALASYLGRRIVDKGAPYKGPPLQDDIIAARETLVGLVREIEFLYQLRYDREAFQNRPNDPSPGYSSAGQAKEGLLGMNEADRNPAVDVLLLESVARLQTAFLTALETGITATDVYRDARVDAPKPGSPTFRYMSRVYPPGTLHAFAFELPGAGPQ